MKILVAVAFTLLLVCASLEWSLHAPIVHAQAAGMDKPTMKALMADLLEAGFSPRVREADGLYFVTVTTTAAQAATAAQVNSFANARGVTARVLTVRFQ